MMHSDESLTLHIDDVVMGIFWIATIKKMNNDSLID